MVTALIPSDRLLEQSSGIKQLTTVLVIVCMIIALALGLFLSSQMTGTIKYILRQLRKVSNGNLTVHLSAKHKDEFGLLCDGVNDTVEHMKSLILDVNDVSQQVGEAAIHVAEASGTFLETSKNIQSAVEEIESGVNKLDTGSDNCMSQMDSLSGKINNVSSNADELGNLLLQPEKPLPPVYLLYRHLRRHPRPLQTLQEMSFSQYRNWKKNQNPSATLFLRSMILRNRRIYFP